MICLTYFVSMYSTNKHKFKPLFFSLMNYVTPSIQITSSTLKRFTINMITLVADLYSKYLEFTLFVSLVVLFRVSSHV